MCCVDEMIREVRARQEIAGSNPSYTVLIFLFDESFRHGYFTRCLRPRLLVSATEYQFEKPVPKSLSNRYNKSIF